MLRLLATSCLTLLPARSVVPMAPPPPMRLSPRACQHNQRLLPPRLARRAYASQLRRPSSLRPPDRGEPHPAPDKSTPPRRNTKPRQRFFGATHPEAVIGYLLMQGFSHEEALDLVREMFLERAATVRANGVKKILTGIGLVAVPIVALIIFLIIGVTPLKIFAVTIMVGLWGLWMLLNGIIMFLAPKSERGDLADQ